jgi:hypothetical protein
MQFFAPRLRIEHFFGAEPELLSVQNGEGRLVGIPEVDTSYRFLKAAKEILPPCKQQLVESDIDRILLVCHQTVEAALDPIHGADAKQDARKALADIEDSASRLASALRRHSDVADSSALRRFESMTDLFVNSHEFSSPGRKSGGGISSEFFLYELRCLSLAARVAKKFSELGGKRHRPKEQLLLQAADTVSLAWSTLQLIDGTSLKSCFPSSRNGGIRWCVEVLVGILSHGWCGEVRLTSRSERRLQDAVYEAARDLREWVSSEVEAEPKANWSEIGWESESGFLLIIEGAAIVERSELLVPHRTAESYFAKAEAEGVGYFAYDGTRYVPISLSQKPIEKD